MIQQVGVRQMKPHKIVDILQSITNNLKSQQLQIEALVSILPKETQLEWVNKLQILGNERGVDPETGERLNTTGELN